MLRDKCMWSNGAHSDFLENLRKEKEHIHCNYIVKTLINQKPSSGRSCSKGLLRTYSLPDIILNALGILFQSLYLTYQ